jgi:hypothetical protein
LAHSFKGLNGLRRLAEGELKANKQAIAALFRVMNRYVGNLPPMPGVFLDYPAPVVRNGIMLSSRSAPALGYAASTARRRFSHHQYPQHYFDLLRQVCKFAADQRSGYLPVVSTFFFSSSFIFLTVGSRLFSPVVRVVVAGGLALGTDVSSGGVFAGRVAVALGGGFV